MSARGSVFASNGSDALTERAADYIERRRCGDWSATDQAELDAWLAESTLHRVAYLRLEGAAAYAEHLSANPGFDVGPRARGTRISPGRLRRFAVPLLAAASIALAVPFAMPLINTWLQPAEHSFSTDVGGRTLLRFVDGTEFELNTDTTVRYRMTNRRRMVWLDKGEAWFHVTHNAANPFTLVVGKHRIVDLGTEFFVRRGAGSMEVALLNGRASLSTEGAQTATLRPGDDAVATPVSVLVTRKTPQELADELAWRRGMLVFRHTPLAEVVREFNRYNATKLVIADPSIAGEKIVADAKADDLDSFLQFAKDVLKLRVDREGGVILISRRGVKDYSTGTVRQ